jgi:hypothetical protein
MFRYAGVRCPNPDCKSFIVWKEIPPGHPSPTVRALDIVSGKCPKCGKEFFGLASEDVVEIESPFKPERLENK